MKIKSDNPAIEKSLKAIKQIIEDEGGYLDPDIVIASEGGGISVEKENFANPDKPLIALPAHLLLDMKKAGAKIENYEFVCNPEKGEMTDLQHKLTELMFDIYNLTDKVRLHEQACLWFSFRETPEILDRLTAARNLYPKQQSFLEFAKDKTPRDDYNEILCDSYFKSRTIGHNKKYKDDDPADQTPVDMNEIPDPESMARLMPIIDFCNHHAGGAFFSFQKNYDKANPDKEFLLLGDHRPLPDSNECFAFYNQLDALDSFLSYGFPDPSAPYVRSVPIDFELPKLGKIMLKAMPAGPHKGKLPQNSGALRPYIPRTINNEENALGITHLMIPTNTAAPQALRRVLRILISNRAAQTRTLASNEIWDTVLEAEDVIINKNVAFYKDLLAWLDQIAQTANEKTAGPIATARHVAELQLTKLYKYNFDESHFKGTARGEDDGKDMAAAE